ncbi:VOC family protein [bacterium]|nr:VOC family protein [bacterium]
MRIATASVFVNDQDRAEQFYTKTLGFQIKHNEDMGNGNRWLTVVPPDRQDDIELLLEPNQHPAAGTFQKAIYEDGIPAIVFSTADLDGEYERLKDKGVRFTQEPADMFGTRMAIFDDTCGNLICVVQE